MDFCVDAGYSLSFLGIYLYFFCYISYTYFQFLLLLALGMACSIDNARHGLIVGERSLSGGRIFNINRLVTAGIATILPGR